MEKCYRCDCLVDSTHLIVCILLGSRLNCQYVARLLGKGCSNLEYVPLFDADVHQEKSSMLSSTNQREPLQQGFLSAYSFFVRERQKMRCSSTILRKVVCQ